MSATLIIAGILGLYFLPSVVATSRRHRNAWPIALTNAFFGWTLIGWVIALIWAFTDETDR